jgi:hypothetical protein
VAESSNGNSQLISDTFHLEVIAASVTQVTEMSKTKFSVVNTLIIKNFIFYFMALVSLENSNLVSFGICTKY